MWIILAIFNELMKNMVNFELRPHYSMAIFVIEKRLQPFKNLTK